VVRHDDDGDSRHFPEWRKLPREVREVLATSEDFLTARTLGAFRFLSTSTLAAMLRRFGVVPGDARPEVQLWPDLVLCEPDALIESPEVAIVVECKFVGSQLGQYATQLGREWLALARRPAKRRYLLALTRDGVMPRVPSLAPGDPPTCTAPLVTLSEQIRQYCALVKEPVPELAAVEGAVCWCSWSELYEHASAVLAGIPGEGPDAAVLREMAGALAQLGCLPFGRWTYTLDPLPPLERVWLRPTLGPQLWRYALPPLGVAVTSPWSTR
jgi:hypothetical protein